MKNKYSFFRQANLKWKLKLLFSLVPFAAFAQDPTWFTDVTGNIGLVGTHGSAVIGLDVNNDNYPDMILMGSKCVRHNAQGFCDSSASEWRLYINTQRQGSSDPHDRVFVDATANSGLDAIDLKDLGAAADFNNDGNIDILTNRWYHTQKQIGNYLYPNPDDGSRLHLLLGDGHGHFTLKQNSGLEALGPMAGVGLPVLDYDRDGNLDLFVPNHYVGWFNTPGPSFLMKGNGDGTFTNVTLSSGIKISQYDPAKPWLNEPKSDTGAYRPMFGANMVDWNNDCWPDLMTAPYENCGYPEMDYNHDNFITYYGDTANKAGYGQLFKNNGNGTFTDVGVTANYNPHFAWGGYGQGMVPWAAMPCDYDNDGDIDFLVLEVHGGDGSSGITERGSQIFTNEGPSKNYHLVPKDGQIIRKNPQSVSHGDHNGFWSDFDNDGWPDLVVGDAVYVPPTDRMFFCRQDPSSHVFTDVTKNLGFMGTTPSSIVYSIRRPSVMIPMDYDMDGDDDIIKTPYTPLHEKGSAADTVSDSLLVLRNDIANKNHFIEIKLIAQQGVNASCIGARVTVKAGGMKQMREIYGDQGSFTNEYPFTLNFGLGSSASKVDSIDVRWPDANCTHTVITNALVDKFITIKKTNYYYQSVPDISNNDGFELYPNPVSNDAIYVKLTNNFKALVEVYNSTGQKVISFSPTNELSEFQIPIKDIPAGMYWVHIIGGNNTAGMTKPFVKVITQ